jgi:hypothetical protein
MVAGIDGGEGCSVRAWREFISQVQVKYCVKEFHGGKATRLKEHLAWKSGNVVRCTKCPPVIREYFLRELQRVREWKKAINNERLHRVQRTIAEPDDEDEELQDVLEVLRREAEFQRSEERHYEHGGGSGRGGVKRLFRRATSQRERIRDFDAARAKAPV